jgi:hypothetical protein
VANAIGSWLVDRVLDWLTLGIIALTFSGFYVAYEAVRKWDNDKQHAFPRVLGGYSSCGFYRLSVHGLL